MLKRKFAEISFVTMFRSIKCKMKYYCIGAGNLCEVEKAWHLSPWGYWKEGNVSLHPKAGFRFCSKLWLLKTCFKEAVIIVLPAGNLHCLSCTNQDVCLYQDVTEHLFQPCIFSLLILNWLLWTRDNKKETIQHPPRKQNVCFSEKRKREFNRGSWFERHLQTVAQGSVSLTWWTSWASSFIPFHFFANQRI